MSISTKPLSRATSAARGNKAEVRIVSAPDRRASAIAAPKASAVGTLRWSTKTSSRADGSFGHGRSSQPDDGRVAGARHVRTTESLTSTTVAAVRYGASGAGSVTLKRAPPVGASSHRTSPPWARAT